MAGRRHVGDEVQAVFVLCKDPGWRYMRVHAAHLHTRALLAQPRAAIDRPAVPLVQRPVGCAGACTYIYMYVPPARAPEGLFDNSTAPAHRTTCTTCSIRSTPYGYMDPRRLPNTLVLCVLRARKLWYLVGKVQSANCRCMYVHTFESSIEFPKAVIRRHTQPHARMTRSGRQTDTRCTNMYLPTAKHGTWQVLGT